jgi:hypothetical protein
MTAHFDTGDFSGKVWMKADWWYSDQFGPVGPFTTQQLRETVSTFNSESELLVWREGFSGWKPVHVLVELKELGLPPSPPTLRQSNPTLPPPLPKPTFDECDQMRASEIKKTLRPTPNVAERGCAGAFILIAALFLIGLILPKDQTPVTPISPPRDWRAQESDVCALNWRGRGLSEEDIRFLRKGC